MSFAKRDIKGEAKDNFKKFWCYCAEIEKTNPTSSCLVKLSDYVYKGGKKTLMRVYICWEACRQGFKYCRHNWS